MSLPAGTRLGPYEIVSPIGAGGMGEVYRARDTRLDRDVAIKVIGSSDEPLVKHPTDNLAAYELYLKGRFLVNQRGDAVMRGLEAFEHARRLDPDYAPAHAGIASARALLGFYGYLPGYEALPQARSAALAAIDLDPSFAEPYGVLVLIAWVYDWDWAQADRLFRRAVALDDRLASAYAMHALHLAGAHGRFDEAIQACKRAVELEPLAPAILGSLASCYIFARRYDEAAVAARLALELHPDMWNAERFLGDALRGAGRIEAALAHMEHAVEASNRHHWPMQELADLLLAIGRRDDAQRLCDEIVERGRSRYVPPMAIGGAHGLIGRIDDAFEWLERAYRERDALPLWRHWPYAIGTNDARRAAIFKRMGLGNS